MRFYRGTGSHGQQNMSNIEIDLMIMFHKAYSAGELLEKPLTDCQLTIGSTAWRSIGSEFYNNMITIPDFTFKETKILVYIDGPPHKSKVRTRRDAKITTYLKDMGWTVLRFAYQRNTKKKQKEIFSQVADVVKKNVEEAIR